MPPASGARASTSPSSGTRWRRSWTHLSPQFAGTFQWLLDSAAEAAKQKDPNFDLRKAIVTSLGDDLIAYQKAPPADATRPDSAPSLYLLGSPQPEQLVAALKALFILLPQPDSDVAEREFLGRKIYSVLLPVLPGAEPPKSGLRTLYYAAASNGVALSTDSGMLEEYLRGVPAGL